ncbi:hypothetical protein ACWC5C_13485 [Streptomyces sp. NPDC001700]
MSHPLPGQSSESPDADSAADVSPSDIISETLAPGSSRMPFRSRVRTISWTLLVGLSIWLIAANGEKFIDWMWADAEARRDDAIAERSEEGKAPFVSKVRYETKIPTERTVVFDRTLTAAEENELFGFGLRDEASNDRFDELMAAHQARDLLVPSWTARGDATVFYLDFFSDRESGLAIVDMRADVKKCTPSPAKTVIKFPTQGGGPVDGIFFDLDKGNTYPIITDEGDEHQGEPYFKYNKIDLGGAATPGTLRVEATTSQGRCEWAIDVTYSDAEGVHVQEVKNGRKFFVAESEPTAPDQEYVFDITGGGKFVDCRVRGEVPGC